MTRRSRQQVLMTDNAGLSLLACQQPAMNVCGTDTPCFQHGAGRTLCQRRHQRLISLLA